jgi:hypothetical protein
MSIKNIKIHLNGIKQSSTIVGLHIISNFLNFNLI